MALNHMVQHWPPELEGPMKALIAKAVVHGTKEDFGYLKKAIRILDPVVQQVQSHRYALRDDPAYQSVLRCINVALDEPKANCYYGFLEDVDSLKSLKGNLDILKATEAAAADKEQAPVAEAQPQEESDLESDSEAPPPPPRPVATAFHGVAEDNARSDGGRVLVDISENEARMVAIQRLVGCQSFKPDMEPMPELVLQAARGGSLPLVRLLRKLHLQTAAMYKKYDDLYRRAGLPNHFGLDKAWHHEHAAELYEDYMFEYARHGEDFVHLEKYATAEDFFNVYD